MGRAMIPVALLFALGGAHPALPFRAAPLPEPPLAAGSGVPPPEPVPGGRAPNAVSLAAALAATQRAAQNETGALELPTPLAAPNGTEAEPTLSTRLLAGLGSLLQRKQSDVRSMLSAQLQNLGREQSLLERRQLLNQRGEAGDENMERLDVKAGRRRNPEYDTKQEDQSKEISQLEEMTNAGIEQAKIIEDEIMTANQTLWDVMKWLNAQPPRVAYEVKKSNLAWVINKLHFLGVLDNQWASTENGTGRPVGGDLGLAMRQAGVNMGDFDKMGIKLLTTDIQPIGENRAPVGQRFEIRTNVGTAENMGKIKQIYKGQERLYQGIQHQITDMDNKIASEFKTEKNQFKNMSHWVESKAFKAQNEIDVQAAEAKDEGRRIQYKIIEDDKKGQRERAVTIENMMAAVDMKNKEIRNNLNNAQRASLGAIEQATKAIPRQQMENLEHKTEMLKEKLADQKATEKADLKKTQDTIKQKFSEQITKTDVMLGEQQERVEKDIARLMKKMRRETKGRVKKLLKKKQKQMQKMKELAKRSKKEVKNAVVAAGQSANEVATTIDEAMMTAEEVAEEVEEELTAGKEQMQEMETSVKETQAAVRKDEVQLKTRRAEEILRLSGDFEKAFGAAKGGLTEEQKAALAAREKLEGDVKENLAVLQQAADLGLGGLKQKLGTFGEELDQTFDAGDKWRGAFDTHLAELGGEFEGYQGQSEAELAGIAGAAEQSEEQAEESVADFGGSLMEGLESLHDGFGSDLAALEKDGQASVDDAEAYFDSAMGDARKEVGNELNVLGDDMRGFSRRLTSSNDAMARANAVNSAKLNSLMTKVVPGLQQAALNTAEAIQNGANGVGSAEVAQQMEFSQNLRKSMDASKAALGGELDQESQRQDGQVKDWIAFTNSEVKAKEGEKTALEKAMRKGTKAFASEEERLAANLKDVKRSAAKLNNKVRSQFKSVNESLASAELLQARNEEELESALKKRTASLTKLGEETISKMSQEQRQQFETMQMERQAKIDRIMRDSSKSFTDKLKAIQAVDDDMAGVLSGLQAEALMTDEEVQKVHEDMAAAEKQVGRGIETAQSLISATDLLIKDDEEKQMAALAERTRLLKESVLAGRTKVHEGMEEEIDAVTQESQARIAMILKHQNMTEAEKREAIAQVDKYTRNALQDLAKKQVALDHELQTYVAEQSMLSGGVSEQLQMLEGVLKDEQMGWLKTLVAEKDSMKDKLETIETTVSEFVRQLEAEAANVNGELTDQQKARLMRMKDIRLKMSRMSSDRTRMADEAKQLAELAVKDADSAGGGSEKEINDIGKKVKQLASSSQASARGLWDQLGAEMERRNEANDAEHKNLVANTRELLDKISDVTTALGTSASDAANKQRGLEQKLGMQQSILDEAINKAVQEDLKKMTEVEEKQAQVKNTTDQAAEAEKEMQQEVGDTTATQEAMVGSVQKEVEAQEAQGTAAEKAAEKTAEASLRGAETKIETQMDQGSAQAGASLAETLTKMEAATAAVKGQVQAAMRTEAAKVDAVVHGGVPAMAGLTEASSQVGRKLAGYADAVQKQRGSLRAFDAELQNHLDALQDEDDLGRTFGDEVKAQVADLSRTYGAQAPKSFAEEDPSAALDDLESRLDDDDASFQKVD